MEKITFELAPVNVERGTEIGEGVEKSKTDIVKVIGHFADLFRGLKAFQADIKVQKDTIDVGRESNVKALTIVTDHKESLDRASVELSGAIARLENALATVSAMIVDATKTSEVEGSKEVAKPAKAAAGKTVMEPILVPTEADLATGVKMPVGKGHVTMKSAVSPDPKGFIGQIQ